MSSETRPAAAQSAEEKRRLLAEMLKKKAAAPKSYPASFAQQRLWFLAQLDPESAAYNIPLAFQLDGPLDAAALERAWAEVVRRHGALRTRFAEAEGEPVQVVEPSVPVRVEMEDLTGVPGGPDAAEAEANHRAADFTRIPFDLGVAPLFRAVLYRVAAERHLFVIPMQHVVMDGWSQRLIGEELIALYEAFVQGLPSPLPEPGLQYGDFAVWQRQHLSGEALEENLAYWRQRLEGAPSLLELPTDRPRPPVESHEGRTLMRLLQHTPAHDAVVALTREEGATMFMTFLAVFALVMQRWSGQDEVVVGTPILGRSRPELERVVGYFANTLALRVDLTGDPTFRGLLRRVREMMLGAYAHQDLPFEKLVDELKVERSLAYSPLYQVMFTHDVIATRPAAEPVERPRFAGVEFALSVASDEDVPAITDLMLTLIEQPEGFVCKLDYRKALFDEDTAARVIRQFSRVMSEACTSPDRPISTYLLLGGEEREEMLARSRGPAPSPAGESVAAMFEAQADRTPDSAAVVFGDRSLTYRELDERATRLARYLRRHGVGPDSRVGVSVERSVEMVVAVLAVLKAGGGYVAMDPAYPAERLSYMLENSKAPVLLTLSHLAGKLPHGDAHVVSLDTDWAEIEREPAERFDSGASAESLGYVLYTSGSTGRPKGVALPQRALVNLLRWQLGRWAGESPARTLQFASLSFDVSFQEIFSTWTSGGTLVLVDEDTRRDAEALFSYLQRNEVERLFLPFAALQHLAEVGETTDLGGLRLREIITAGEQLRNTPALVKLIERTGARLENQYGPTESHVVSAYTLPEETSGWPLLPPIGAPITGVSLYVLDGRMQPQPVGVPGELYIGGFGLARGYLDRPDLTAEKFVPNPFSTEGGARLYRTGDRVRWLETGEIEFLGRIDHQVKVRGFRIELGEIEAILQQHPAVLDAVAMVREDTPGDRRVVAYVSPAEGMAPRPEELREHLRERVPDFMLPSAVVVLERLPLSPNGKVDRKALPAPERRGEEESFVAPRTAAERALAAIWAEVLKTERIGANDNFFDLGGHSLLATRVISRIRQVMEVEVPVRVLFETPTLAGLAARVSGGSDPAATAPPIVPVPRDRALPLSFAQERLWVVDRLVPGTHVYNIPLVLPLSSEAEPALVERVLAEIVRRHEALRTTFREEDGQVVQVIHPAGGFRLEVVTVEGEGPAAEAEMERRAGEAANRPFDLAAGPLFRATLVRGAGAQVLAVVMHHIVSDGWSIRVLSDEIEALARAFAAGEASPLPDLPVQYADFAVWQRAWLTGETLDAQAAWWRERLAGAPALLELPTDRPRPSVQSFVGAGELLPLPNRLVRRLRDLGRAEGATLFSALLAGWNVLLSRWSGQDDVVVGVPVAGRDRKETEGLIGFFVNNLVIRTGLVGDPGFRDVVSRVQESMLGAMAHQDLPFERLVDELKVDRSLSHTPVFQVSFGMQSTAEGASPAAEDGAEAPEELPPPPHMDSVKYDLSVDFHEAPWGLVCVLEYSTALFDRATVRRLLRQFRALLEAAADAPTVPVSRLALADAAERERLLSWGRNERHYPRERTIASLFEEQAAATPAAVAVESADGAALTYSELNARANCLARRLREMGIGPESRVGLSVERSPETIIALLAILKAGAAYVPLDPSYPADRLAFMLADSGVSVLIVGDSVPEPLSSFTGTVLSLSADAGEIAKQDDANLDGVDASAESLAYVIYTSGSTGRPKGAAVPNRAVVRLVKNNDFADFGSDQVFLQFAPVAFDASTLEVWGPLLNGAKLVLFPAQTPSLEELGSFIQSRGITTLWLTAGLFHQMVDSQIGAFRGVRQILAGGDVLSVAHARRVVEELPAVRLINGYGPTENTTFTCCHTVTAADVGRASIPIGKPVANTTVYVLDGNMQPVPVGVPGELYTGGDGLARGYLNQPELTAEKFVHDPFSSDPEARLYRTGDRVRWLEDGTIEFLGRLDEQVKVRGFRIEPGEIESALVALPGVEQACVIAREDVPGDKRLVAYVVAAAGVEVSPSELRASLGGRLPDYMVPSAVVVMDALPLTTNGKVDRRALPAPEGAGQEGEYVAPAGETEERLAAVWAQVLGVERVSADAGFFELGGHSLLATRVISRIRQDFGVELPLRALFEAPTVAGLAAKVDAARLEASGPQAPPIVPVPRDRALPLSFAQERLWVVDRLVPGSSAYNVPFVFPVPSADAAVLERTLGELVRRHESLRTTFREEDGRPVQVIHPADGFRLSVVDLSAASEAEVGHAVAEEYNRPFNLEAGPLFRATLLRLGGEPGQLLILNMHHIVSDGWSMDVLVRELEAVYRAFAQGEPSPLPELEIQYADFAVWQRSWLSGEVLEAQLAYWRKALSGVPTVLELPTDRPRPPVQSFNGATVPVSLPEQTAGALSALALEQGGTPFMALLAAFGVLLSRWSGQEDVVVGSPIAGRNRSEIEGLVGFFVNNVVLRTDLSGDPTFRELVSRVKEVTLGAYAHQDLPFEKLVEELKVERSLSHTPLFQVMFALQNTGDRTALTGGPAPEEAEEEAQAGPHRTAKFDLTLNLTETGSGFAGAIEYNTDLFGRETIRRMGRHFRALAAAVAANPDVPVSRLSILGDEERRTLLEVWNDTSRDYPKHGQRIHDLFEAQAERTPDAIAVDFAGSRTTYAALNHAANRLARHLRTVGVGPDVPVGVCVERSLDMIVALLAVLKAGGAYVPIDPSYPTERIGYMLEDTGAPVVITHSHLTGSLLAHAGHTIRLDTDWERLVPRDGSNLSTEVSPENLAYVIYTSGSTGRPKGVAIEHRSTVTLLHWLKETVSDEERRAVLGSTSISFDVSIAEIFGTLCWGGTLVLVENALSLAEVKREVVYASMVPSAAAELLRMGAIPPGLKTLTLGGEALPNSLAQGLYALGTVEKIGNGYGPTEDTTYSTYSVVEKGGAKVYVGRPVANTQAYVLDRNLQPAPIGVPGELWLAGEGLSRGYWRRPGLTAERYLPNPFGPAGSRMYRVGDLVRYLPDGTIEYLGRLDHQVKIRGFRIETGEIESALAVHPKVQEAVVVARESGTGGTRLVAYLVPAAGATLPDAGELRSHLKSYLPEYMVPSAFVALEALPLSPNGKVDRRALPAPSLDGAGSGDEHVAPRNETEEQLAAIWTEVLGLGRVSVEANFFELGGHSLLATQVVSRIRTAMETELPLRVLFEAPTIAELAVKVVRARTEAAVAAHKPKPAAIGRAAGRRMNRSGLDGAS